MSCKLTGRILGIAFVAGLMMFVPMIVEANDTKEKSVQSLEAKVKEAVREFEDVTIEVKGKDVTLKGYVNTQDEKTKLESQVRQVPGIAYVRDEVKIGQSRIDAIEDSIEDSAITTKLKAKILATKGLESFDIHVKTTQGAVTLSGKVNSAEDIKLAEKVVRETKGVKKVINTLSVK